ncbi:serine/threonine-protein kinase [Embleya sp. NBC_00888]|uniref:serine/threonine-protein kinase n=1 Tax=Embleya sp. NBC_00888 TaxID=2975960 RepID=UPI003870440E|nr:serine/threonine-protein kinase [Embleya sp. NBC_00888]
MRPLHDEDPSNIGAYRLVGRLGEGTTARTYLGAAHDDAPVVVRVIRADLGRDPAFRARFGEEVDAARRLAGPGTAMILDADITGRQLWYATTHLAGPTLAETVRRHGPLPGHSLRVLAGELAGLLGRLHAVGLYHGRLDPGAVLLGPDGPLLPQLGIAHGSTGSSVTADGVVIGTVLDSPGFRSPEQVRDLTVGPPTDVFSLGSVLAFAATGTGPFDHGGAGSAADRVAEGDPELGDVPASLRNLIAACLVKDPTRRPDPEEVVRVAAGTPGPTWLPSATAVWVAERVANPWEPPEPMPGSEPYAAGTVPAPPPGSEPAPPTPAEPEPAPAEVPAPSAAPATPEPAAPPTREQPPARTRRAGSRAKSRRGFLAVAAGAAVVGGGAAAWALGGGGDSSPKATPTHPAPPPSPARSTGPNAPAAVQELTVWTTENLLPAAMLGDLGLEFGKSGSGVRLGSRLQPKAGYTQALEQALRAGRGPDVFELDLLALARFKAADLIMDLTPHQSRLDAATWFPAVRASATSAGRLMALPLAANVPVVLYDKGLFQAAQVGVPTDRVTWVADLEKLRLANATNPDYRALYVPGGAWPILASCVWEDDGTIAVQEGDAWRGTLDLPGSVEGARFFRHLQSYAADATGVGNDDPAVAARVAKGNIASAIADSTLYDAVVTANPALRAVLGAFPIPGRTAGKPAAVGVRGTVLAVNAASLFKEPAIDLLALVATERWRARIAAQGRLVPVRTGLDRSVPPDNPMIPASITALPVGGRAYPGAPGWSERPLAELSRQTLAGSDPLAAAAAANGIVAREFGVTPA